MTADSGTPIPQSNVYVDAGGKWWRVLPCGCCVAEVKE